MFSFHKPKVYRTKMGCCICGAKSSSSRFTDTGKYREEFGPCFWAAERFGEICNACVLLIKRFKKLPPGSTRNWHHVVDTRLGPGTRSSAKSRSRKAAKSAESSENITKKHRYIRKSSRERSPVDVSDDQGLGEERYSGDSSGQSVPNSLTTSPIPSDDDAEVGQTSIQCISHSRRKQRTPSQFNYSGFIDFDYWKLDRICCGTIFRGALGEVLIDCRLFKPCCQAKSGTISASSTPPCPEPSDKSVSRGLYTAGGLSDGGSPFEDELHDYVDEGMESYEEDHHHLLERYYTSSTSNAENEKLLSQLEATYPS